MVFGVVKESKPDRSTEPIFLIEKTPRKSPIQPDYVDLHPKNVQTEILIPVIEPEI